MIRLFLLALLLVTTNIYSQTFSPEIVKRGLRIKDNSYKHLPEELFDRKALPLFVKTPALQLTFTQVQRLDSGWTLTSPVYLGYSYLFTTANGLLSRDSSMSVENRLFFGAGFNIGLAPNSKKLLSGSIPLGVIAGYSRYGMFAGLDLISGEPILGISINMINFPLLQKTTRFLVMSDF